MSHDEPKIINLMAVLKQSIEEAEKKRQQPAPAAPVTDAYIEAAIENAMCEAREQLRAQMAGTTPPDGASGKWLRTLIARRVQQATAAAEDLARAFTDLHYFAMTAVEVLRVVPEDAERHAEQKFRAASSLERSRLHALDALAAFRKAQGGA